LEQAILGINNAQALRLSERDFTGSIKMKPQKGKPFRNRKKTYKKSSKKQTHSAPVSKKEWNTLKSIYGKKYPTVNKKANVFDQFFNQEIDKRCESMLPGLKRANTHSIQKRPFSTNNNQVSLSLFILLSFGFIGRAVTADSPPINNDNSVWINPETGHEILNNQIKNDEKLFPCLDSALIADKDLLLECMKKYPAGNFSKDYASLGLDIDPDFNYKAIEINSTRYDETSEELKKSLPFMLSVINLDKRICDKALEPIKMNPKFQKACARLDWKNSFAQLSYHFHFVALYYSAILLLAYKILTRPPFSTLNRHQFFSMERTPLLDREISKKTKNIADFKAQFEAEYLDNEQFQHLFCPLSLGVAWDPVLLEGYTFDRVAIERSLSTRPHLNPMTNSECQSTKLFINRAVRDELIQLVKTFPYNYAITHDMS
jgi:hypothetical protein